MELEVGDVIEDQDGPFRSRWRVVEVKKAGAVLHYVPGSVEFVGYGKQLKAPNGDVLTASEYEGFLGRGHWPSASVVAWEH